MFLLFLLLFQLGLLGPFPFDLLNLLGLCLGPFPECTLPQVLEELVIGHQGWTVVIVETTRVKPPAAILVEEIWKKDNQISILRSMLL